MEINSAHAKDFVSDVLLVDAVTALAALGQETRIEVFRRLSAHSPAGLPAGEIARELGVAPATMSFHLSQLEHAGLITGERRQRQIFYRVSPEGIRALVRFLTADCCHGRPELCGVEYASPTKGNHS
ncbi:MAG: metalloregulator ArsR/SmtB family transcription factor [Alphaproteobacteria bacterium]